MKKLLLALILVSTSVFAQEVKVVSSVIEMTNLKKTYNKVKVFEGMKALVAANGAVMSPGMPAEYKSVYTGYTAKSVIIDHPTALEADCLAALKNNFIKARTELGIKSANGLSKLGIANVNLIMITDMDKKIDGDVIGSLIEISGIKGRENIQLALLSGTKCISQSKEEIVKALKARL